MKNTKHLSENPIFGALRSIVIGSVAGAALCAALLGLCALGFVSAGHIPQSLISPMVIALSVFSSFMAGFIAAKVSHKRGLAYGALAGLMLFALFLISGLIASREALTVNAVMRMLVMILSGALGGLMAVSKKTKVK